MDSNEDNQINSQLNNLKANLTKELKEYSQLSTNNVKIINQFLIEKANFDLHLSEIISDINLISTKLAYNENEKKNFKNIEIKTDKIEEPSFASSL